ISLGFMVDSGLISITPPLFAICTPSTIYKGSDVPFSELVPRTRTLILPPGADEFWVTCTPATLACKPCARLLTAVCFSSSPFMVATEQVIDDFLFLTY